MLKLRKFLVPMQKAVLPSTICHLSSAIGYLPSVAIWPFAIFGCGFAALGYLFLRRPRIMCAKHL